MSEAVRTEVVGEVLVITLDRPKANAFDVPTSHAMYEAFRRLEDDPSLRVGILTGGGDRFFSAGWDLKAAAAGEAYDADHGPGGAGGLTEFFDRTKPVIAAVNGIAVGGGFELALAADLIVAADDAEFGLPEVRIGGLATIAALYLPRRVSDSVARDLLLTGRRVSAGEAARWGLVCKVIPKADLMRAALEVAEEICAGAPLAIASVREVLARTATVSLEEGFKMLTTGELTQYQAMVDSEDLLEGPRAFTQKRPPQWRGR